MNARELFQAGKLHDAIQALSAELRDHPTDTQRRTFLFELLCFAGDYERAAKHLNVVSEGSKDAQVGGLLYRSALAAEVQRQGLFQKKEYPSAPAAGSGHSRAGTLNGRPFQTIADADPRIGSRLEVFVAGEYVWLPFEFIGSVHVEAPKFLRDLLWATARVATAPGFKDREFGEVLLPALCPLSWQHPDESVRLGRATEWQKSDGQDVPFGQKLLVLDDEEVVPFLEVRELQFAAGESEDPGASSTTGA
jgi:type VI secretion system protein ImpE